MPELTYFLNASCAILSAPAAVCGYVQGKKYSGYPKAARMRQAVSRSRTLKGIVLVVYPLSVALVSVGIAHVLRPAYFLGPLGLIDMYLIPIGPAALVFRSR
jgi:hypothetical protein